jgi:hypothetical protein
LTVRERTPVRYQQQRVRRCRRWPAIWPADSG